MMSRRSLSIKLFVLLAVIALSLGIALPTTMANAMQNPESLKAEMHKGWNCVDDYWYYLKDDGDLACEYWLKSGGHWYYFDEDCAMVAEDWAVSDGEWYYFNAKGEMVTGWLYSEEDGIWYYLYPSGKQAFGWVKISGKWYYFEEDEGAMACDELLYIDEKFYRFDDNGAMVTGWWLNDPSEIESYIPTSYWSYYDRDGAGHTGWLKSGGKWYYLEPGDGGLMVAGVRYEINGKMYQFSASGAMLTGWQKYDSVSELGRDVSTWYYYNANGASHTGWLKSGGKWYYLDEDGMYVGEMMYKDNVYLFLENGAMLIGWIESPANPGQWGYARANGALIWNGWFKSGGKWYYFNNCLTVVDKTVEIDGKYYHFNKSGAWDRYGDASEVGPISELS